MRVTIALAALVAITACQDRSEREKVANQPAPALAPEPKNDDAQTGAVRGEPLALPTDTRDVQGTVARSTAQQIVIRPAEPGDSVTLRIRPGIPITVDGRAAETVPEGARIRASYTFEDGDARALKIEAERSR